MFDSKNHHICDICGKLLLGYDSCVSWKDELCELCKKAVKDAKEQQLKLSKQSIT